MITAAALAELLGRLSLEEKVELVSGASFWTTAAMPTIGLRAMVLSDGPSGVRGLTWDERFPSLSLPSASALAAAWDPEIAYLYGAVAAGEARRKGVDIVLGPTINLHRSPLGGRHFEAFSEDPLLSGQLAAAYVRGLQNNGVAATPKHFVANDSETERFTVDIHLSDRALYELYLVPFELAVEAGAWAIMVSYNAIAGVTMTESALLTSPLTDEWGFDGVALSDWTAVRSLAAAAADIDLAMPGPVTAWSDTLAAAVRDGAIAQEVLDRKVLRMLRLADRVGALAGSSGGSPAVVPVDIDGRAFAREAAIAGTVLLENHHELPWNAAQITSVAVIGEHASMPRIQGGGSATVIPDRIVSPLDGIRAALPDAEIHYEIGAAVQGGLRELPLDCLTNPHTGGPGLHVTFLDGESEQIFVDDRLSTALVWFDGDAPLHRTRTIVCETTYRAREDADIEIGFASSKRGRVFVDGALVLEAQLPVDASDVALSLLAPPSVSVPLATRAGVPIALRAEFDIHPDDPLPTAASATLGYAGVREDPADLIARAVTIARQVDVAVVVVGTTTEVESEGIDRSSLDLPGGQDDLVRAVIAANPRTVVVVNAGSPVIMPWRADAAAVLLSYFGGQEMGAAIAAVLTGEAEPGGRLTTTWPAETAHVPVLEVVPTDGVLAYAEGINIGYRAWLASPHPPAYPFGWGLGYTEWEFGEVQVEGTLGPGTLDPAALDPAALNPAALDGGTLGSDAISLNLTVSNTGHRAGKQVVQVYAERLDSAIERPPLWLVGSAVVHLDSGASAPVSVPLRSRSFAHWAEDRGWTIEPGEFTLRIGTSVADLPFSRTLASSPQEIPR